jgi:patatin-like phospholipase/acyl hydrolase
MKKSRFQILSLDGGGLKGIFIASFLASIEKQLKVSIIDHFDLIAGTSTGGIIALGLGIGLKPKEILSLYLNNGLKIFPAQNSITRLFLFIKQIFFRKYSSAQLSKILKECFAENLLGHSKKRLLIPAFDSIRGRVYIYKTAHHKNLYFDYKEEMWNVALATSAAPTYFPSYVTSGFTRLIDGGIWANNPSMIALTEAIGYLNQNIEDIYILSIGTTHKQISTSSIHKYGGFIFWSKRAVELLMCGQDLSTTNQLYHILGEKRFLRVNPTVNKRFSMDKLSKELISIGETEARDHIKVVKERFLNHLAPKFIPAYKVEENYQSSEGRKNQ